MTEKSTLAAVARASTDAVVQATAAATQPVAAAQPAAAQPAIAVQPAAVQPAATQPAATQPVAAQPAAETKTADPVAAAKQRIAAILTLPTAKGREALAQQIALTTDLSVEQATALLSASPEAKAGDFDAKMRGEGNPNLGSGAAKATGDQPVAALWDDAVTRANKALPQRATKH